MLQLQEYGIDHPQIFLLLHNDEKENWNDWERCLKHLAQTYHVVVLKLNGKTISEKTKISKELADWISKKNIAYLCSLKGSWKVTKKLIEANHVKPKKTILELQYSSPESLLSQILIS